MIMQRILQLQTEESALEQRLKALRIGAISTNEIGDLLKEVENFVTNFEEELATAPHSLKKLLIERMILKIEVQPDERKAYCYVSQIPNVTRPVEHPLPRWAGRGTGRGARIISIEIFLVGSLPPKAGCSWWKSRSSSSRSTWTNVPFGLGRGGHHQRQRRVREDRRERGISQRRRIQQEVADEHPDEDKDPRLSRPRWFDYQSRRAVGALACGGGRSQLSNPPGYCVLSSTAACSEDPKDRGRNRLFGQVIARQFSSDGTLEHHVDAMTQIHQFREVCRVEQDSHTFRGELCQKVVDLHLRCRCSLLESHRTIRPFPWRTDQPLGEHHLLLVATAEDTYKARVIVVRGQSKRRAHLRRLK